MRSLPRTWKGWFITFEGVDGAGKTTQLRSLGQYLRQRGLKIWETREPGGSPFAEQIRDFLLDPRHDAIRPKTELLLVAAARAQHVEEGIMPALERGEIVLCDRYFDATVAYQGAGRGFPIDQLRQTHLIATGGLMPDLTFLIDVPVNVGLQRLHGRPSGQDRFETESPAFYERVRQSYLDAAKHEPNRFVLLDGTRSIGIIQERIKTTLQQRKILVAAGV